MPGFSTNAFEQEEVAMANTSSFWPNNARLAVSLSLMYEGGGQPISGAPGVIPEPIKNNLPDMPTNGVFQYGIYEGTPRLLDLMDKHNVKLSAFMIGQAVDKAPGLAKEVVRRGHEAAAHGRTWTPSYDLSPDDERRFIEDNINSIQKATGQTPRGWSLLGAQQPAHAGYSKESRLHLLFGRGKPR
jgi:peptidoglycan/xylan/chitin deacetylase (PgdA/CDA1 family)